jgi:predicted Zn-dependent protease with MMP-like domain
MKLTRNAFEKAAADALRGLPRRVRRNLENIDVVVEDQASEDVLEEMDIESPFNLLGLYQGVPVQHRGFYYGNVLPDKITLYQIPIESICRTEEEIKEKVREVFIHEIGHYFGLDDARLRELEGEGEDEELV